MNLVLDFGNTSIKAALFENNELLQSVVIPDRAALEKYIHEVKYQNTLISSVSDLHKDFPFLDDFEVLSNNTSLPFSTAYATPSTLGSDRIAAIAGAQIIFPKTDCLVIDTGTCITYDLITAESIYKGGGISPGINMRFEALHNFTAKLPLVQPSREVELVGNSTEKSILSGVMNGVIGELNAIVAAYKERFPTIKIVLCGGDNELFESKLKESIFVQPKLVLYGLNRIIEYNEG